MERALNHTLLSSCRRNFLSLFVKELFQAKLKRNQVFFLFGYLTWKYKQVIFGSVGLVLIPRSSKDILSPKTSLPPYFSNYEIFHRSQPGYLRARHFLLALRDKVIEELNDMIHRGTLLKVETLYWGSPIVNLLEPDGKIHICELYSNDISRLPGSHSLVKLDATAMSIFLRLQLLSKLHRETIRSHLKKVYDRIKSVGTRLKKSKCVFYKPSVSIPWFSSFCKAKVT
ncbi:unnamed protein product [Lepeophtheirus salmonis]|uniref:(salmon louse) hypothetical protein n=1 Tax=Lepeophtheirus salmonis TaxID=72036 RepID=A0A7R8CL71_LEPSM|nr:unnamed protein product [Lepeophtheirus salmonis]CAF2854109.1 unnamed protein product [Lepeophtheirus salmonis]